MTERISGAVYSRLVASAAARKPLTVADIPLDKLPPGLASKARELSGKIPTRLDCLLWIQEASGKSVKLNPATNEKDHLS